MYEKAFKSVFFLGFSYVIKIDDRMFPFKIDIK